MEDLVQSPERCRTVRVARKAADRRSGKCFSAKKGGLQGRGQMQGLGIRDQEERSVICIPAYLIGKTREG
jgi:hypothetical protein